MYFEREEMKIQNRNEEKMQKKNEQVYLGKDFKEQIEKEKRNVGGKTEVEAVMTGKYGDWTTLEKENKGT